MVDLQVPVPDEWIDNLFPEVRRILECVKARNARLRSANPQAEDRVSDRAVEGFLQSVLYAGICFWQNLPFRTERYVQHDRTCLKNTRRTGTCLSSSSRNAGASAAQAVNLMTHIAQHFKLSLDQVREGSRLLAGRTAKTDSDTLTTEMTVTLGDFKAAVGWAYAALLH